MEYKLCFLDTIVHARRQFDELGRPKRPTIGDNKTNISENSRFQDWQVLAKIMMNKQTLKSLYWILFAEDELFNLWRTVCRLWIIGEIPDGSNEIGKPKPAKLITVAMFRCFEGELTEEEICSVLEGVRDKKILLKKDFSYKGDKLTMDDWARKLKTAKKLKDLIMLYYKTEHPDEFGKGTVWSDVIDKIPALAEANEFWRCRRAAGEAYLANLLKRNFPSQGIPPSLSLRLKDLYCRQFGKKRNRVEPYMTFFTDNLMKTVQPDSRDQPISTCQLAIVDFSRKDQRHWTDSKLLCFFEYIVDCSDGTIVLVITVLPGQLFSNIMVSLNSFVRERGYKIHLEFGSYDRLDGPVTPGALWTGAVETVLFAGILIEENIIWADIFKRDDTVAFNFDPKHDVDFSVGRARKQGKGKERIQEEQDKELNEIDELMDRAPRFEMVGDTGGFVNPFAKPRLMYHCIIVRLSKPGDTILDFFSGGQVLRVALLNKRECFAYSDTDREYLFTGAYGAVLCATVPSIKTYFFEFMMDDEDLILIDPKEADVQAGQGPIEEPRTAEGVGDEGVGDPQGGQQDVQVYTKDPNERACEGETMNTGYGDFDPLDNFAQPSPGAPELGRDRLEAPVVTSGQGNENLKEPQHHTEERQHHTEEPQHDPEVRQHDTEEPQHDAEEGEILKESAGDSTDHEAGASTFSSSPLFCSSTDKLVWAGSSGSPVVLRRSDRPGKSLGKIGYTKLDATATHYVYKWGAKKGMKVSCEEATSLTRKPTYPDGLLVPVWGTPFRVEQCPGQTNFDLQNTLGDNVIDEYGSFSDPDFGSSDARI
ncbi:unnamed protein product [Calypogeia fissa]